ncbi:MAG: DNA mismatch repair endonuclease MutL, partial [Verrucomicrobiota bacterium]
VVKELVENALDAGATRIEVEFRHGGRAFIRVEDNGGGMARDDALLALERHATSKLAVAADLDRLHTFGFRGEALPSIASIARFTLQTRATGDEAGTEILVNGGKLVHVRECGRPVGTRIEVADLFNSVPARRKFLKTDATEAAHIVAGVRLHALACPRVAFTLTEDGRVVFRSPQCADLAGRVAEIFGRQLAAELVPVEAAEAGLRLTGLIGRPGLGRATRHELVTFVNGRPVDSRTLSYAVIESYHESVPKGRYPMAFLFFECDPAAVDVNVHPAKREVRFRSEPTVRGFVIRSVLTRLREMAEGERQSAVLPATGGEPRLTSNIPTPTSSLPPLTSALPHSAFQVPRSSAPASALPNSAFRTLTSSAPAFENRKSNIHNSTWRFLGVAHSDYALFETAAGLVLLDRRAAHERVWFEQLREQFGSGTVPGQRLLLPVPLELDPVAAALLLDRLKFINAHGFEITEFGRNFFRIEAVPDWMEPGDAEPFVRDLLGALRDGRIQGGSLDAAREQFARLAAARAVRLPAAGGEEQMRALLAQLFATRAPLTSPAGRPTFVELNHGELARRFQK